MDKVVSVKRKNVKLVVDVVTAATSVETEDNSKTAIWPGWLCDVPDRLSSACLHELVETEPEDVADLLLKKYVADMEVEDCNGVSPLKSSTMCGAALVNKVAAMITREAGFRARQAAKVEERSCSNFGLVPLISRDAAEIDMEAVRVAPNFSRLGGQKRSQERHRSLYPQRAAMISVLDREINHERTFKA